MAAILASPRDLNKGDLISIEFEYNRTTAVMQLGFLIISIISIRENQVYRWKIRAGDDRFIINHVALVGQITPIPAIIPDLASLIVNLLHPGNSVSLIESESSQPLGENKGRLRWLFEVIE